METKHVVYVNGDDWVGLYVNGQLREEGHSIPISRIFKALGIRYSECVPAQEWLENKGSLPQTIDEVKRSA